MNTTQELANFTATEAETLAAILRAGLRHMATATTGNHFAWVDGYHDACDEIILGYSDIISRAVAATGNGDLYLIAV
jgi:hypothetical protein